MIESKQMVRCTNYASGHGLSRAVNTQRPAPARQVVRQSRSLDQIGRPLPERRL